MKMQLTRQKTFIKEVELFSPKEQWRNWTKLSAGFEVTSEFLTLLTLASAARKERVEKKFAN
jgi:hypothetical protein